jgi:hypothetical protein
VVALDEMTGFSTVQFSPRDRSQKAGALLVVTTETVALYQFDATGTHTLATSAVRAASMACGPFGSPHSTAEVLVLFEDGSLWRFGADGQILLGAVL